MRRVLLHCFVFLWAALFTIGCIATHSYIDPARRVSDEALRPAPAAARPAVITVAFQRNGKPKPRIAESVAPKFIADLTRTGHFRTAGKGEAADRIDITLNNVADMGAAAGKGFGTGLTLGLAGSRVSDGYVMTVHYTAADGRKENKEYRHEIESTIGLKSAPEGRIKLPLSEAFDRVVDDLSRMLLLDLAKAGYFTAPPAAVPVPEIPASTQPQN